MKLFKESKITLSKAEKLFLMAQSLFIFMFFFPIGYVGLFQLDYSFYPYKIAFAAFIVVAIGTVLCTYRITNYGSSQKGEQK